MAIPNEFATSNPVVRDALALIPVSNGTKIGDFVAPDLPIPAETVEFQTVASHSLDLDDIRAVDAEAKEVLFAAGDSETISVVERAFKSRIDTRTVEAANEAGVDIIAQRSALLRDDILDLKEYRIASKVMTAANYASGHKDITGLNFRTGDLLTYIDLWKDAIEADGNQTPLKAVIGKDAWRHARRNADFREFAGGTDTQAKASDLTLAAFAEFLGLDEVKIGKYSRKIGNATSATQFWPVDSFLLFAQQNTLSDRTLAVTPVVPYGAEFGNGGQLVDVRTEPLPGVERRTEFGTFHRYRVYGTNFLLGFLVTGIVGT